MVVHHSGRTPLRRVRNVADFTTQLRCAVTLMLVIDVPHGQSYWALFSSVILKLSSALFIRVVSTLAFCFTSAPCVPRSSAASCIRHPHDTQTVFVSLSCHFHGTPRLVPVNTAIVTLCFRLVTLNLWRSPTWPHCFNTVVNRSLLSPDPLLYVTTRLHVSHPSVTVTTTLSTELPST